MMAEDGCLALVVTSVLAVALNRSLYKYLISHQLPAPGIKQLCPYCISTVNTIKLGMAKRASWNGQVLAESDDLVRVEGNDYFPESSLNTQYFKPSDTHTTCPWKGKAAYYHLEVNGEQKADGAWYYPDPKAKAKHIENRVAFHPSVNIENV